MQESVEVYERLGLKAEYVYAYRMLIYLLLEAADFNALSRELAKFVSQNATKEATVLTKGDLENARLVLTRLWNGQSPNDLQREKGVIQRASDGLVGCGLDKVRVFGDCVVPPVREFFRGTSSDSEIIETLLERVLIDTSGGLDNVNVEMRDD
uniref:Uncharacterized protein n=1 Tax=Favella ehrenbergii TaxID=182087 RepID=A0A7S3MSD8_9SPIT|mmetsp:Transcript_12777/g.17201  ORF Transcript_12777/g.17201 Transcript_12777/m.17201 type:complete len:153 (+) Transcript_12777:3370-3828(+)|eukprot:CAMPEP_0185607256 /NCGR_PEP_ID=MMETSP0436-20130131/5387_1 /TAXON_ID=626734 ORGANISM="Favella taraikaensis, Strain Fe Narragansett Bay" /NCGR_SAMPLE_ID=MMETSP0436 /ASSEMBLY_ACC=CAM_ASM_000390 /LENGTH=152 /DNA_ID=CAMNT_0028239127 /DNA_START=929 /DNA_END=1387 /DNA_ORIENTATION=+